MNPPRLKSINIKGYRPFKDFSAQLGPLEVIVGANGSGKSSLFEFLRFLRDSVSDEIPPEIIPGAAGQRIFHSLGPERLSWEIQIDSFQDHCITYQGEVMGPVGRPRVISESVETISGGLMQFDELQQALRSTIPGFSKLTLKAYGAPGHVMAFWKEEGIESELTLADLSDGILQLICWAVLCIQPNPPSLICIDEPDQGVHPRTLPFLAGLLEKASDRTQVLVATHSSYFLTQFDISRIAVMRKENGEAKFLKAKDSKVLIDILEDFGPEEIENLHLSDELEYFA